MSHKIWLESRLDLNCINTWDSTLVGNGGGMSQWIDYGVHQSALRILPGPRGCQVHGDHLLGILRIERVLPARTGTRREGARELFQRHQWWAAKEGVIFWTPLVREGYASIKAYQHPFYEAQRMPVSCLLHIHRQGRPIIRPLQSVSHSAFLCSSAVQWNGIGSAPGYGSLYDHRQHEYWIVVRARPKHDWNASQI